MRSLLVALVLFAGVTKLVVEATKLVVEAVRSDAPMPSCRETRLEQLGGECR
ncbi:MAG TPA: hypothetical protein VFT86_01140 [Gaiellaceae bacterium]|nr:hypothetical protein [Gaiellaceae bacterium]